MSELYIQNVIRSLKQLEIAKEKIDKEIKEHESEIKKYMLMYNLEELQGMNGEKAIYKEILGRRFDSKSFKQNFADLYYSYMKDTKSLRFKFSYQECFMEKLVLSILTAIMVYISEKNDNQGLAYS